MLRDRVHLPLLPQPAETNCGPTCLHAVHGYLGWHDALEAVLAGTGRPPRGGTEAVFLACDALCGGFDATTYTYNLQVCEPIWFGPGVDLAGRLGRKRAEA